MFNTILYSYFTFLNYFYKSKENIKIQEKIAKKNNNIFIKPDLSDLEFFKFKNVSVEKRIYKDIYTLKKKELEIILWYKYTVNSLKRNKIYEKFIDYLKTYITSDKLDHFLNPNLKYTIGVSSKNKIYLEYNNVKLLYYNTTYHLNKIKDKLDKIYYFDQTLIDTSKEEILKKYIPYYDNNYDLKNNINQIFYEFNLDTLYIFNNYLINQDNLLIFTHINTQNKYDFYQLCITQNEAILCSKTNYFNLNDINFVYSMNLCFDNSNEDEIKTKIKDNIYDCNNLDNWKIILGNNLHNHYGDFTNINSNTNLFGFDKTIINLYKFIGYNKKVLDVGCGWGGTMKMLDSDLNCDVEGVSPSINQIKYVSNMGYKVFYSNFEDLINYYIQETIYENPYLKRYDVALFIESFEHIKQKPTILKLCGLLSDRIIMIVKCNNKNTNIRFEDINLDILDENYLKNMFIKNEWKIKYWENIRIDNKSNQIWDYNLRKIKKKDNQLFENSLNIYNSKALENKNEWINKNPVILLVADKNIESDNQEKIEQIDFKIPFGFTFDYSKLEKKDFFYNKLFIESKISIKLNNYNTSLLENYNNIFKYYFDRKKSNYTNLIEIIENNEFESFLSDIIIRELGIKTEKINNCYLLINHYKKEQNKINIQKIMKIYNFEYSFIGLLEGKGILDILCNKLNNIELSKGDTFIFNSSSINNIKNIEFNKNSFVIGLFIPKDKI